MTQEEWLKSEIIRLTAERDAAIHDLKRNPCLSCVYDQRKDECKARIFGLGDDCHEWIGLCAENAPEGGDGNG